MQKFYFMLGKNAATQPYYGGWIEVEARDAWAAAKLYRQRCGVCEDDWLPCSSMLTEAAFISSGFSASGNAGAFCHERLRQKENGWALNIM